MLIDHKALATLLNANNKKNQTRFIRLTRWIDRIIPFDFIIEPMPGAKLADYVSRSPMGEAQGTSRHNNTFTVAEIIDSSLFQPISLQFANTSINWTGCMRRNDSRSERLYLQIEGLEL